MLFYKLADVSVYSSLIPFIFAVIYFRDFSKDLKIYAILFGIAVVSDQAHNFFISQKMNSWILTNIWILIEYVGTIYVFSFWQKNNLLQKILRWSIPVYIIFWVWTKIFQIEDFYWFPYYTRSLAGIIISIVAIYTLIKLTEKTSFLYKHYQFWICSGALLYFSGNIVFFSLSDLGLALNLFNIHSILNILANILYGVGFWCHHYQLKHGLPFY